MKIWATSDTHFGHEKLIQWGRPPDFGERLLKSLASAGGDMLIHCGDFCIGQDEKHAIAFMQAASRFTRKVLVRGNHDHKSYSWYLKMGFSHVCETMMFRMNGRNLLFSHIPILKRPNEHWGAFPPARNIHGHLHGNNHREGFHGNALYDPAYHYDLAPEIHGYRIVDVSKIP